MNVHLSPEKKNNNDIFVCAFKKLNVLTTSEQKKTIHKNFNFKSANLRANKDMAFFQFFGRGFHSTGAQ